MIPVGFYTECGRISLKTRHLEDWHCGAAVLRWESGNGVWGLETETAGYGLCQWWVLVLPVLNTYVLVFLLSWSSIQVPWFEVLKAWRFLAWFSGLKKLCSMLGKVVPTPIFIKHHNTKTYRRVEVHKRACLPSELDWGELSPSCPDCLRQGRGTRYPLDVKAGLAKSLHPTDRAT
jgi:hypothetical protein